MTSTWNLDVDFGGTTTNLVLMVDAWAGKVMTIHGQLNDPESDKSLTGHDLIGAVYLRQAIGRALRDHGVDEPYSLQAVDTLFLSFTVETVEGLRLWDDQIPSSPAIWLRVPARGPIHDEYLAIRTALNSANASTD